MTPNQTLVPFPEFANSGTKVQPEAAKYAEGFIPSEVLPAEWLNFFLNRSSAGQTALNEGVASMEKEINNVLSQASITPALATENQLITAMKTFFNNERKIVSVNTNPNVQPAATGVILVNELYDGLKVSLLLKKGFYTAIPEPVVDPETEEEQDVEYTPMTFTLNSLGAKKVYIPFEGTVKILPGTETDRQDGNGEQYWYAQPYVRFELEYDTTLDDGNGGWVVTNNPVVLNNLDEKAGLNIYADGTNGYTATAVNGALTNCLKNPKTISFIGTVDIYNGFYVPNLISDYVFILRVITNEGYICEPVYQTNTEVRLEFGNAYGFPDIAQNTQVAVNVVYIDL